jgi:hypothetical protein
VLRLRLARAAAAGPGAAVTVPGRGAGPAIAGRSNFNHHASDSIMTLPVSLVTVRLRVVT